MAAEETKALVRRFVEEVWNGKNADAFGEFYADEFLFNGEPLTPAKIKDGLQGIFTDIPDLHHTIEDMIAEGDKVTYRWIMRGNSQATGKQVANRGITFMRVVDGKIAEDWYSFDPIDSEPGE